MSSRRRFLPAFIMSLLLAGEAHAQVSPGEILISEMNCVACHEPAAAVASRLASRLSPRLGPGGLRLSPEWIAAFLENPQAAQPGTLMPDLLHALPPPEKKAAAEALTHYLVSLQPARPPAAVELGRKAVAAGRELYHRVGCFACHAPEVPPPQTDAVTAGEELQKLQQTSVPLGPLAQKYPASELAHFLHDPLAVRPSGRMPSLGLTPEESTALAAYLLRDQPPDATRFAVDPAKAQRGGEVFAQLNCASCHPLEQPGRKARPLPLIRARQPAGCLSPKPPPNVPRFELTDRQRVVLLAALGNQAALDAPLTPSQQVKRTMTTLNCYGCHSRDRRGGAEGLRREYFTAENPEERFPPTLAGVGKRLTVEEIAAMLANGKVRPGRGARMPQFGARNVSGLPEALVAADR